MIFSAFARPPSPTTTRPTRPLLGPSWFAAVMGTGIVADAAVTLPRGWPWLRNAATVVWLAAAVLLVLLAVGYFRQRAARLHAADPVT
ncbi:MAG: C4-dicarboxylate ABC transporter, partial [Streptomyces sp.]|nr:C4-dicarboxylate ABC transporter [Streptomyces sp.]